MLYRIICYYGCFARDVVKGGCLSKMAVIDLIPDYFDNYVVMETRDRWDAIARFAREYHTSKVDLNAHDYQNDCDCVGVTFYTLQEYDKNGCLEDIILESDFSVVNLNNKFRFDSFRTYCIDTEDYSKVNLIGISGNRFYRINSSGDILEELDGEPYYEAGYTAEEASIYDAIDQTELSLMEYCDEYPEEIGSIAFRKNGYKIVVNEEE